MTPAPPSSLVLQSPATRAFTVHRLAPSGLLVTQEHDGTWTVYGHQPLRAVAVIDLTQPATVVEAQARLTQLGVDDELARAGARPGELVRIGRLEFTLQDHKRPHITRPAT